MRELGDQEVLKISKGYEEVIDNWKNGHKLAPKVLKVGDIIELPTDIVVKRKNKEGGSGDVIANLNKLADIGSHVCFKVLYVDYQYYDMVALDEQGNEGYRVSIPKIVENENGEIINWEEYKHESKNLEN